MLEVSYNACIYMCNINLCVYTRIVCTKNDLKGRTKELKVLLPLALLLHLLVANPSLSIFDSELLDHISLTSLHSWFFTTVTSVKMQYSVRRRHIKILSFLKVRYDKSTRFRISKVKYHNLDQLPIRQNIKIGIAMNEKLVGIAFPDLKGKMDFNSGFTSGSIDFHEWRGDIFSFYSNSLKKLC
jgi:hypothetical protein